MALNNNNSFAHLFESQVDAHEDRIQRAEDNSEETRIAVAEVKVKLEHQQDTIEKNHEDLAAKIAEGFGSLNISNGAILTTLSDHATRIKKNEESLSLRDTKRANRADVIKKTALACLCAAAGVLGSKAITALILYWGL